MIAHHWKCIPVQKKTDEGKNLIQCTKNDIHIYK